MLGRRPNGDGRRLTGTSTARVGKDVGGLSKKRKWQEELSGDEEDCGDDEGCSNITKAEMEAWRKTIAEEERQEQLEHERWERREREEEQKKREKEEKEARQRKERENAESEHHAEEAKKAAEEEAERRKRDNVAPPGPLPPDLPGSMPPGMRHEKMYLYKTSFCKRWEQGCCQFGAACHFAHGERELRGRPPKGSPAGTMSVQLPQELPKPALVGRPPTLAPPPPTPPPAAQQGPGRPMGIAGFGMLGAAAPPAIVGPPMMSHARPIVVPPPMAVTPPGMASPMGFMQPIPAARPLEMVSPPVPSPIVVLTPSWQLPAQQ